MEAATSAEGRRKLEGDKAQRIIAAMRASVASRGAAASTFDHVAREAAGSLKDAADSLRGAKRKKRGKGRLLLLAIIGGAIALAASEGLRKKVLDALFGAEEEFEYTASTTPEPSSTSEPVGTA